MTIPNALHVVEAVAEKFADTILLAAGTVLDGATARQAIIAGAQVIVSPCYNQDLIQMCRRYSVIAIPGAATPNEILTAWEMGADMVKVFPASILGPGYLKAVHGPLPQIPLVPTGGITADNAGEFIKAGAAMVCVGGWSVGKQAVAEGRYEVLTERTRKLVEAVRNARCEALRCNVI